jgi:hypothetical protein
LLRITKTPQSTNLITTSSHPLIMNLQQYVLSHQIQM